MAIARGFYKFLQKYGTSASELTKVQEVFTLVSVTEGRGITYPSGRVTIDLVSDGVPNTANIQTFLNVYSGLVFSYDYCFKFGDYIYTNFDNTRVNMINMAAETGVIIGIPNVMTYLSSTIYGKTYTGEDLSTEVYNGHMNYRSVTGYIPYRVHSNVNSPSSTTQEYALYFRLFNYDSTNDKLYVDDYSITGHDASLYIRLWNTGQASADVKNALEGMDPIIPPWLDTDPYSQGGNSGTGGGTGTFSDTGDIIGVPSLPTLSAVDTGFISLFNPSASQIKALANYMWSQNFDLSLFKNVVANPIECILGLTIVPVDPPNAGTKTLTVGNIPTDVSMPYLSSQYVEVDCGTLNIAEFWGSYLDYSPYTKIQLYLPYIGIVPVDIDDMQNSTIKVVYHVDVLSGACVAYVLCGGTQLYTYIGQCSSNIPVTSNDFTNTVNGILGIAGAIGSLVATEGATAPQAVGTIASSAVNALKPNIQKSGSLSGTGGMLGVQTPYLICQRPRQSVPVSQNHFTGYPSNITYTLSDLSGYTEVQDIHLDNVPCTDAEMNEILEYLTGGVVI